MLMNYHEMTMNEARDSPERRKQFLIICTVMAAALIHSVLQAGALSSMVIEEGNFPGGDFVYKETKRDYAASGSLEESIAKKDIGLKPRDFIDNMYSVFLDDPNTMGGRRQRFASGLLINKEEQKDHKALLLSKNEGKVPVTKEEILSLGAIELWPRLLYETATFPAAKAATLQHAYSGGFVSSIVLSMKIIPAMRKYVTEHATNKDMPITVITTCSSVEQVCTHYAPLEEGEAFMMGNDSTETYLQEMGPEDLVDMGKMERILKTPLKWLGLVDSSSSSSATTDETTKTSTKEAGTAKEEESSDTTAGADQSADKSETSTATDGETDDATPEEEEEECRSDTKAGADQSSAKTETSTATDGKTDDAAPEKGAVPESSDTDSASEQSATTATSDETAESESAGGGDDTLSDNSATNEDETANEETASTSDDTASASATDEL